MSGVKLCTVASDDHDIRLDRWFKRHYASVSHGVLEKLLRTGQIKLDGKKTKSNVRISEGQVLRIPPMDAYRDEEIEALMKKPSVVQVQKDVDYLKSLIIYEDADLMIINKPAGLASQGGSGTKHHVDGLLMAMAKGDSRPVLVHRLDKDTSGCLVIAKKKSIAAKLGEIFQTRTVKKYYWALLQGHPLASSGKIDQPLVKRMAHKNEGEKMFPADAKEEGSQKAVTYYKVLEHAGRLFSWVVMQPITGRTHQLRVHSQCLETPMVGDFKYGAMYTESGLANQLHLHARRIQFPHPKTGKLIDIKCPLPPHMKQSWSHLGFTVEAEHDDVAFQFAEFKKLNQ